MIKIEIQKYDTAMGKSQSGLSWLDVEDNFRLNEIGYSNSKQREWFLNKLNIGTFKVVQIKFDSGDFQESFMIIRAYEEEQ